MKTSSLIAIAAYVEHPGNYCHGWNEGTLCTTFDTKLNRNIFTTVFVLLNLFIVFAGAFFLKERNLRRLRSKREVPMNHLTSWISATDTVTYAWDTFQLPGGFYGLLMFATGAFGLVQQYFVNSFIVPAQIQSNCTFDLGTVTTLNLDEIPSSTLQSANTIHNAQLHAVLNDGEWGIYEKVNYTSATFRPTSQDVIGRWNCTHHPHSMIAWRDWQDQTSLISFLQNQRFLFDPDNFNQANQAGVYKNDGSVHGFLAWDASKQENLTKPWIVRASVSTNLNGSAQPSNRTARVTNLECHLVATPGRTLPDVNISGSLMYWREETFGFLMSDSSDSFKFCIEWTLNAMVMAAGSGNNDQLNQSHLSNGTTSTFGCKVQGTKIMVYIWAILGALLLVLVSLVLVDIFLMLSEHFQLKRSANLVDAAPCNVQEWQLAIIREVTGEKINARQMRDYSYGWDAAKEKYVLDKNTAFRKQSCTESTVAHTSSEPANWPHSPPGPAFSGFIGQRRSFARLVPMV